VEYPDEYPETLPNLSLQVLEGSLDEEEIDQLMKELLSIGEENLGMAMTFTLVSHLREKLPKLLQAKLARLEEAERETERLELEVIFHYSTLIMYHQYHSPKAEEARTRGTPVTQESFLVWKVKFDKEMAKRKLTEQEERYRNLPPKEREEQRKIVTRLTG